MSTPNPAESSPESGGAVEREGPATHANKASGPGSSPPPAELDQTLRDDAPPDSPSSGRSSRRSSRRASRRSGREQPSRDQGARQTRRHRRPGRRHPDIEVARLLVKRGFLDKPDAVKSLKLQKQRAKRGKKRVPFLQLLVKQRLIPATDLPKIQDEIRSNTYLCDACQARAVILAGSQSRAGNCPRCGAPIFVDPPSDPGAVPRVSELVREQHEPESEGRFSGTLTWRPMGNRSLRALEPGQVAFDRYLLREELGRGAMGIVYRARHLDLEKDVAIKVLVPHADDWEHQVARFRREAAAVQKLRHPGIVQVHDFGTDGEVYYLTMDLVQGGESLHRRLKRTDDPPPLDWRLGILEQVARAVDHAHQRGVVHRDLKPANVLLDPSDRPLVADFGLAKDDDAETGELTRTQDRLGTPLFMAPEQIRLGAASVDGRADVWALGVILFVCVTGRYPFRSRTVLDLYSRILAEEPDWDGTRYSAPDRRAPLHSSSSQGQAPLADTQTSPGEGSEDDEHEKTEAGPRTKSGKLPRTLPEPAGFALEAPPPPFSSPPELAGRSVPAQLKAVIRCALAKDVEDRYPTATAFADDLERYLAGEPVVGGGPSAGKRMRQALDRKRVLKPLVGALAMAVTLSVGWAAYTYVQFQRSEKGRLAGVAKAEAERARLEALTKELSPKASEVWERANKARTRKAYLDAKIEVDGLLNQHPALIGGLEVRARLSLVLLRPEEARRDLAAALKLVGEREPTRRAELLTAQAYATLLAGDARGAAELAAESLGLVPMDAGERVDEALATLLIGALESGDEGLRGRAEALAAQRSPAPAWLTGLRAQVAIERGQLDAAEALLKGADEADLDVATAAARATLARGAPSPEAYAAAERAYEKARARPRLTLFLERTQGLARKGQKTPDDWRELRRLNVLTLRQIPYQGILHWYVGNTSLQRLGELREAAPWIARAAELGPFDWQSHDFHLAILSSRPDLLERMEAAIAFCTERARLRPTSPRPLVRRALLELRLGRLTQAWASVLDAERRGAKAGPIKAAVVRLATPADREALTKLAGWSGDAAALEREHAQANLDPKADRFADWDDWVGLAWLYLESGHADQAAAALERTRAATRSFTDQHRKRTLDVAHRRWGLRASLRRLLRARIQIAQGQVEKGVAAIVRIRQRDYTKIPMVFPDALKAAPDLTRLAGDARLQPLFE